MGRSQPGQPLRRARACHHADAGAAGQEARRGRAGDRADPLMAARVHRNTIRLPMARLGPPSTLPRFRFQQPTPNRPTPPNVGLTEEESRHGFTWGEDSILPYQVSDDYDREVHPAGLDVMVIDNGRLRAIVAPSLGRRLLELKDQTTGRDLV